MLSGRDIVCLSTQDWQGLWTRKQRFMKMFAENGNRILYVETPVHMLGLDVLPHDPGRVFRFLRGPRAIEPSLHVATLPILLPFFQMSPAVNAINQKLIARMLRSWIRRLGFSRPLLWLYTPHSAAIVASIEHEAAIYECVDDFRGAKGFVRADVIGAMEDELLKHCDLTIVTQESLMEGRTRIASNIVCIPNGADTEIFQRISLAQSPVPHLLDAMPHPRLCFVGHIHYWVDLALIRYLAQNRPQWSFVMIGPIHPLADRRQLQGLQNVHLLGRRSAEDIPLLLREVQLCLNPYKADRMSIHASPLKLYEYLAAGKPVISTEIPEARKFPEDVRIGRTRSEFLMQCEQCLESLPESAETIRSRLQRVSPFSWKNRFAAVNEAVERILDNPAPIARKNRG